MHQSLLSKYESPLLNYAVSKLSPGVFSHPIWVRFGNKDKPVSPETIQVLLGEAEQLRHDNPSEACQLLLICAVYQSYSHQHQNALMTIHHILEMAKRLRLLQEIIWANWGACAVCVQQGNYEQAVTYLYDLQDALTAQEEWIVAGFIDIVRQSLLLATRDSLAIRPKGPHDRSLDDQLARTFDWLQHWGLPPRPHTTTIRTISTAQLDHFASPSAGNPWLFSVQHWKEFWHKLKLAFRRRPKVRLTRDTAPQTTSWFAFYGNIPPEEANKLQVVHEPSRLVEKPVPIPVKEIEPPSGTHLEPELSSPGGPDSADKTGILTLEVQMLGPFSITVQGQAVKLSASRALSLLKYLMYHHKQSVPREILMDVFWPDAGPRKARNNLNVAMHHIRKSLCPATDLPVIQFQDGMYGIAPYVQIWLDTEEFEHLVDAGKRLESRSQLREAISNYEAAISLIQGNFLEENSYEGWTALPREHLRLAHLDALDRLSQIYYSQENYAMCISLCQRILTQDRCREDSHCMLMRCYNLQGQDHLALRQYQACVEALRLELDVTPAPETTKLYEQIRQHKRV